MKLLMLFLAVTAVCPAMAYKILCVFPVPSRSHAHLAKGIVRVLLKAGHEVTWATPFPEKKVVKNLKYVDISVTLSLVKGIDMSKQRNGGFAFVKEFSKNVSTLAASNEELMEVLVKEQFDAVITEHFFSDVDAGYAAVQQVPWLVLNGVTMHTYLEYLVDDMHSLSTVPILMNDYPIPMNFWQRLGNTAFAAMMLSMSWLEQSNTAALYESLFAPLASARGVPLAPFSSAHTNISILFVNSHPSMSAALPLPPNVVEIAGYHIDEDTPPLPKDLQELMDSSPQGVVYFSMGSVLKSSEFPQETRRALAAVLGELPQTVLWKFEQDFEGLPGNVHTRAWMPQASVLAHPNVRLFITHGGMLSTLEALRYGVPLLAVPVFGDQPGNAARAQRAGYARALPFHRDLAPELRVLLNEMLRNDSYYSTAKYLSKLFRERPVSQASLIAHYTKLAIETNGAYHLRSKARFYSWYQRWMLDQVAFVSLVIYLVYYTLAKIIKKIFYRTKKTTKSDRRSKKNN